MGLMKKILKKILTICIIAFFIFASIPYVYTSQVLTAKNLAIFNDCLDLFNAIPSLQRIRYWEISTSDNSYFMEFDGEKLEKDFSEVERQDILRVRKELERSVFFKAERQADFILFFTSQHPFSSVKYGACYSINGEDPNKSSNKNVWQKSPYIKVKDNWYISRELAPELRIPFRLYLPENSLIDHSTKPDNL